MQVTHELEVVTTDYEGEDTVLLSGDLGHRRATNPLNMYTAVRGRLHLRLGNVGKEGEETNTGSNIHTDVPLRTKHAGTLVWIFELNPCITPIVCF